MAAHERELRFTDRMSDHEALMWSIEKDPWLNPNGASLTILDRPLDLDHFRATMRNAVVKMPRLYERVVPGLARLSPPAWAPDPEFDIDFHVRHVELPAPGSERELLDLAARLYQEPLDRTRPLWRFVVIDGVEGGRSALWAIMHHAISDGIGQLRMAELYQQLDPERSTAARGRSRCRRGERRRQPFGQGTGRRPGARVRQHGDEDVRSPDPPAAGRRPPRRWRGDDLARGSATGGRQARRGGRDRDLDRRRTGRVGQRRARRIAAVEAAIAAPPTRVGVGAARRSEGGRPAFRCLDQRSVPGRADRGRRAVSHRPGRRGRRLQHQFRAQHAHRQCDRGKLVHPDPGAGRRCADVARRTRRRHSCPAGGRPGGDGVRGRHERSVGHRQPAAHVGGHAGRPRRGGPDRLRDVQPAAARRSRCTSPGLARATSSRWVPWRAPGATRPRCRTTGASTSDCSSTRSPSTLRPTSATPSSRRSPTSSVQPGRQTRR